MYRNCPIWLYHWACMTTISGVDIPERNAAVFNYGFPVALSEIDWNMLTWIKFMSPSSHLSFNGSCGFVLGSFIHTSARVWFIRCMPPRIKQTIMFFLSKINSFWQYKSLWLAPLHDSPCLWWNPLCWSSVFSNALTDWLPVSLFSSSVSS